MDLFTKAVPLEEAELSVDGTSGRFQGYGSVFNGEDSYGDTILENAYEPALKGLGSGVLPIFFNHAIYDVPIGKWTSVTQTNKGLFCKGQLTLSIGKAAEVYEALKAGTVTGLSVGIGLQKSDYDWKSGGMGRTIKSVSLLREISVVNFPADSKARVSVVKSEDFSSVVDSIKSIRDIEELLRDAGFSKSQALTFVSKVRAVFDAQRDSDARDEQLQAVINQLLKTANS